MNNLLSIRGPIASFPLRRGEDKRLNPFPHHEFPVHVLTPSQEDQISREIPPNGEGAVAFDVEYAPEKRGGTNRLATVLFWHVQDGILVGTTSEDIEQHEWMMFGAPMPTGDTIRVQDPKTNIRYVSDFDPMDANFICYLVGVGPLLKYISGQLSLEDLGVVAVQERLAREVIAQRDAANAEIERQRRQYITILADHCEAEQRLSEALYRFALWVRNCYRRSWLIRTAFRLSRYDQTLRPVLYPLPFNSDYIDSQRDTVAKQLATQILSSLKE